MMMNKKAQAAMEFLMTYGWAILVVLVVIGTLAYFGVLNPTGLLPEKCLFQTGIYCEDHLVDDVGNVKLKLNNGLGKDMTITTFTLDYLDTTAVEVCAATNSDLSLSSGQSKTYIFDCGAIAGINKGEKAKIKATVTYNLGDIAFSHTLNGDLLVKVEVGTSTCTDAAIGNACTGNDDCCSGTCTSSVCAA